MSPIAMELLRVGERPNPLTAREQLVYELSNEVVSRGTLSDDSYARGAGELGDELMVELVGLCGYYTLVSFTLNVFHVPVPEGENVPFPR